MLSERAKNWLAGPKALIVAAALVGLIGWGGTGLIIGGVAGLVASVLVGVLVRRISGGMIPRKVRKELVEGVAIRHPEVVEAAYPDIPKTEWYAVLEDDAEALAQKAVELAPSNEMVWSESNMIRAVQELAAEQESEEHEALYQCMGWEIVRTWY